MGKQQQRTASGSSRPPPPPTTATKMSVARINIKNIDYFKYKKLVIDANRDDYLFCSKEVKGLCDCVQTLKFRDEEFDDDTDRGRFEEICNYYRDILDSKRIDPTDMRIKSGWWGDHKNSYSAGKLKPLVLREVLSAKAREWERRRGTPEPAVTRMLDHIDGPGIYVFKHKEHQCFQSIGRADKIFARVAERLKMAYEGALNEPLAALLIISMERDWDFYFIPVGGKDDQRLLRILENDLILKHDCIWPHGLNFRLHIDSLLEVSEFRKSCLRHHWPPDSDQPQDDELDLSKLRLQVHTTNEALLAPAVKNGDTGSAGSSAASTPSTVKAAPERVAPTLPTSYFDDMDSASQVSAKTYTVDMPGMSAVIKADKAPASPRQSPATSQKSGPSPPNGTSPSTMGGNKSPRPTSAPGRSSAPSTPRKTASRLRKPTGLAGASGVGRGRPKSGEPPGLSREDLVAGGGAGAASQSGSLDQIDTQTVILSRSSSRGSVNAGEEGEIPGSPARTRGAAKASRLQRPSSSKSRPDSLHLQRTAKPR